MGEWHVAMSDGVSQRIRRALVGAGAVLFIGAGGLLVLAAIQPWDELWRDGWSGAEPWLAQEHVVDHLLPGDPWLPVTSAAVPGGAAQLMIAAGLALVFAAVRSPWWSRGVQVVVVGSALALGLGILSAGRAAVPVETPTLWWWAMAPWLIGLPLIAVVLEWAREPASPRLLPTWVWMSWLAALLVTTPVPRLFLMPSILSEEPPGPLDAFWSVVPPVFAGSVLLVGLVLTGRRARSVPGGRPPKPVGALDGAEPS